jgi:2-desacetyl-2-hydroxyethyl bacteriochlorophyllide A dehydrogenase
VLPAGICSREGGHILLAKALICNEKQQFSLEEVRLPEPSANQIAIKTHYSGVSVGTEFALIRNKISWGPYPLCTGYMGTGTVVAVGADVTGYQVGDKVYYRRTEGMELINGQKVSCVSGVHCSHSVITPDTTHGAAHVPAGVTMDVASMFVMPAVGLYGVDMANPRLGSIVVVYGVGLIGLGVVAACAHRGCVVVAIDLSDKRLELARELGADYTINASRENVPAEVKKIAPKGADAVFECTGLPQCINPAIELCRQHGTFVWQGNYGAAPLQFSFLPAHGRRLQMFFPCDDGYAPCRRAVLKNMAMGALKWEKTITHRVSYKDAPALFDRINKGQVDDLIGAVLDWTE